MSTTARRPNLSLPAIVVMLTVMIALMLLAFATPAIHSGANDLPLAVGGPAPATAQIIGALEVKAPGAFATTRYATAAEAIDAILQRDAVGGITAGADGITIVTASAAGAPYGAILKGIGVGLEASGQKVTYLDIVPLTTDDPAGSGVSALALPLVFGGLASAVLLSLSRRRPSKRVAASLAFSALAGLTATALLQFVFGSVAGSYWLTSMGVTLGIAAISLTVLGLESFLGYPGLAIGGVTMLFIANPLAGMATGPWWLPQPWGTFGQYLPVGAAGTIIRSMAFFDGHGSTHGLVVLACWIVFGLTLTLASSRRHDRWTSTHR